MLRNNKLRIFRSKQGIFFWEQIKFLKKKVRLVPIYVEIFLTTLCGELSYSYPPSPSRQKGGCHGPNRASLKVENPTHRGPLFLLKRRLGGLRMRLTAVNQWGSRLWARSLTPLSTGVDQRLVRPNACHGLSLWFISVLGGIRGKADLASEGGPQRKRPLFLCYSSNLSIMGYR